MLYCNWEEFLSRFAEKSLPEQKQAARILEDFGPGEQVLNVALELAEADEDFAARFLERAMDHGVRFSSALLPDLVTRIREATISRMADTAEGAFTQAQLEQMEPFLSDETAARIAKANGLHLYADDCVRDARWEPVGPVRKPALLTALASVGFLRFV